MYAWQVQLRSLPLHEVLAAPLTAAMEAQQQAALGLVSFIQDVGFTSADDETPDVRMVDFRYTREGMDADGKAMRMDTRLRVPLLSLMSLPNLEIESLNVNVLVGFQGLTRTEPSPRLAISPELQARYSFLRGHTSLRVTPTSRTVVKGATQTSRPYDFEITLAASSEEPTEGVHRILTALTGMMTEETR